MDLDTLDYANHIENYRNITHYDARMNSMQLNAIANKPTNLMRKIDSYLKKTQERILNFNINSLIKQVQISTKPDLKNP